MSAPTRDPISKALIEGAARQIVELRAALDRVRAPCDETDVDSYEAQQGWLVAEIRTALDGPDE